jgi:ribose 5-phosphate isomerase B
MKIAIGSDHAGFHYKEMLRKVLEGQGHEVKDFGTYSEESSDYADFAHPVSTSVESSESKFGVLVCGSANGVAITANKHAGIRAAICWTPELASLARAHNDGNIVCIPARFISEADARTIVDLFLSTAFEGGRHARRVGKIAC